MTVGVMSEKDRGGIKLERLGLKRAIKLTKEMWTELAKTGDIKGGWSGWKMNGGRYDSDSILFTCFLCEHNFRSKRSHNRHRSEDVCPFCPFYIQYGRCTDLGQPYKDWHECNSIVRRKVYAKQCLEQLQEL